ELEDRHPRSSTHVPKKREPNFRNDMQTQKSRAHPDLTQTGCALSLRPVVRRGHVGEALDLAERKPRHFRAREQLVAGADARRLVEGAGFDGDHAGAQLDLVEHAGAAGRAEEACDAATGFAFRAIGARLTRHREAVARHRQAEMKRATARALAVAAVAEEAAHRRSRRSVAHRAAQTLSRE